MWCDALANRKKAQKPQNVDAVDSTVAEFCAFLWPAQDFRRKQNPAKTDHVGSLTLMFSEIPKNELCRNRMTSASRVVILELSHRIITPASSSSLLSPSVFVVLPSKASASANQPRFQTLNPFPLPTRHTLEFDLSSRFVVLMCFALVLLTALAEQGQGQERDFAALQAETKKVFEDRVTPFFKSYCTDCHGIHRMEGGINFAPTLAVPGAPSSTKTWKQYQNSRHAALRCENAADR